MHARLLILALFLTSCVTKAPEAVVRPSEVLPKAKPNLPMAPPTMKNEPRSPTERRTAVRGKPLMKADIPGEKLSAERELPRPVELMLKKAEEQMAKKELSLAHAQAERAYRMESTEPRVSFLLARLAFEEGDFADAEQWAQRSLEVAQNSQNKDLLWRFISRCRQKTGNARGAADALRRH